MSLGRTQTQMMDKEGLLWVLEDPVQSSAESVLGGPQPSRSKLNAFQSAGRVGPML